MPSLKSDLVKRIQRLPKPQRTSDALQPLFEAISNSIHAVQERFGRNVSRRGRIDVNIQRASGRRPLTIVVTDNGIGLDDKNFDAFLTTDTDNKLAIGGKGVGRLLWLDCFEKVLVSSNYVRGRQIRNRSFTFSLGLTDQIGSYEDRIASDQSAELGCRFEFRGLRKNGYFERFPTRLGHVFRHVTSHFLPTFIGLKAPQITVTCADETRVYPEEIQNHIFRTLEEKVDSEDYGPLRIVLMECDKVASSDLKGKHFVHFIAHDRTVKSQSIDGKLGIGYFGEFNDRVFHACVFGRFLDRSVNQERTDFIFEDVVIDNIIKDVCMPFVEAFLREPLAGQKKVQATAIEHIVSAYPSVGFGSTNELQSFVPIGELSDDAIYGHLSRQRFRRDVKQQEAVKHVLSRLREGGVTHDDFAEALREASRSVEETSQRSLAEYVVRRKVIIDFVEILVRKTRTDAQDSSYQREDILHTFICPMKINAVSSNPRIEPASHDLWIIDERLTFSSYFSSDVPFNELAAEFDSEERPDVLIFDKAHGLRYGENPSKVLIVEFKRPGRDNYADNEDPRLQIERYVKRLQSGTQLDMHGRPVRLSQDTVFYGYIVADCVGRLEDWTYSWSRTADGRGRIYRPESGFKGSIELIEWDNLLQDARERNSAFFNHIGVAGPNIFDARRRR